VSLLQRALAAQLQYAPNGIGARLRLVTNWRPQADDALSRLIRMHTHALDLDRLFDGTTPKSMMGKVLEAWSGHLGIDHDALRLVARTLAISQRLESGGDLRERLNDRFAAVGMRQVPPSETGFFYDDLIKKLHAQGRNTFDRASFHDLVEDEKLLAPSSPRPKTLGVRSFMHPIDDIEARSDESVNLVPHFDGRYIHDQAGWKTDVFPELQRFLIESARDKDELLLILDTHVSLAFGVGAILNVKSRKTIKIEQRAGGRHFWSETDKPLDPAWPILSMTEEEVHADGTDLAVAVSLTHDVVPAVRRYVQKLATVGTLMTATPWGGPSYQSVRSGMGPVETETYRRDWRAAYKYRRHVEKIAEERAQDLILAKLEKDAIAAAEKALREAGEAKRKTAKNGVAALREAARRQQVDEDFDSVPALSSYRKAPPPVAAASVAARLMFARLFDASLEARKALAMSAPVVIVDVPDAAMMDSLAGRWRDVLFDDSTSLIMAGKVLAESQRQDAVFLEVREPPKAKDKPAAQKESLLALSLALPFVAISPLGATHLPEALLKACTHRLEMPRIDSATITRMIRSSRASGAASCSTPAPLRGSASTTSSSPCASRPAACLAELRRLVAEKEAKKKSRDLTLGQLHGMADAVAWAKDTIADLADWKAGSITWDAVDNGVALTGPPGTGKSTFAKVFASEAGLPIVLGTLAKWQSSGEAHLGHLLRAMRQDFDVARAAAPSVMFIDEIDSFPDRAGVQHAYRDYDDVFATAAPVGSGFGASVRTNLTKRAGTYDEYRRMLEIILAGRVGEELILGAGSHGAGGEPGSDLDRATAMAAGMAGSFGLAGANPLVYLGAAKNSHEFMAFEDIRRSVRKELESAAASCRELLERHHGAVEAVAGHGQDRWRRGRAHSRQAWAGRGTGGHPVSPETEGRQAAKLDLRVTRVLRRRSPENECARLFTGLDMRNQTLDFMNANFGKSGAYY
jgi:SMODS-associated and fused to various effectors sensor domain/ATPase family associated with various cellular activities (AAA)